MMKCLLFFNVFYLILAGLVIMLIFLSLKTFSNKSLKAFIITIAILILLGLYAALRLQLNQKVFLNISASTDFQEPSFISLIT